jgi:inorganic pyrophosphatase
MDEKSWSAVEALIETSEIIIDRPRGSRHPLHSIVEYPLDYGYLSGTRSGDQAGIDIWIGSRSNQNVVAIVCTVDLEKSDAEIKILIGCTEDNIAQIMQFHNHGAQAAVLVQRENPKSENKI